MAKHPYLPRSLRRRVVRAPRLQRALWRLEAGLVAVIWTFLRALGPDRAVRAARACASRIGPRLPKSSNMRENLAIMFPERSERERAALERETWGEWGAMFADLAVFDRIVGDPGRLESEQHGLEVFANPAQPAVFAASHLANAPLAMWAGARLGAPTTVLMQPVSNPFVERMIRRRCTAPECDTVPREGAMRALVRALARGRSIAIVPDLRYEDGELVPFFGVPTPTVTTPARLALRHGCELVPVRVERLGGGARFRVTFYEAVRPRDPSASAAEQALDMTRQLNASFEQWIRERPAQWITARRRWPRRAADTAVELARALG